LLSEFVPLPLSIFQWGLIGLLIGLIGLAIVTRTERGRRMFYEGPAADEEGDILVGCFWVIILQLFALALLAGVIWVILQLIEEPTR
jgi:hypothetical protein